MMPSLTTTALAVDFGESVRAVGHHVGPTLLSARDPSDHRASGSQPTGRGAMPDEAPVSASLIKGGHLAADNFTLRGG
jgi:hypothetical protein